MFLSVCFLFTLLVSSLPTRIPSKFSVVGGKAISVDKSVSLDINDVNAFLENLARGQWADRRTFGSIEMPLLNTRPYTLMFLLDTDSKVLTNNNDNLINIDCKNSQFMKFSRKVYDNSYTLASIKVNESHLGMVASAVNGRVIDQGISINGVSFSLQEPSESRFIDDIRRIISISGSLAQFEELRTRGAIELTLVSTYSLPEEKKEIARSTLKALVESIQKQYDCNSNWIVAIIYTNFDAHETYNPSSYEHPLSTQLSNDEGIVSARFARPIHPMEYFKQFRPNYKNKNKKNSNIISIERINDDNTHKQYEIGPPREIKGDANFQFIFWTFVFLIVCLIVVSILMWNMKTFEDPLIYYTEYVLDADSTIMEDNL